MKVYERLAANFAAEGVTTVFGMMGSATMHWAHALDQLGIRQIVTRHEGVGCGMADGWARATRTVGVCTATKGPGVTQLATALMTASRAASPIVAFVGECTAGDYENAQYFDQARFAAACETGFVRVDSPDDADEAVRRAFYLAQLESSPIMLSAPDNVQRAQFQGDEPYKPSSTLLASPGAIPPNPEKVAQAVDIIASSRKPVIVVGRGAMWSGAGNAVIRLGERIGALIATTLRAKNWLGDAEYHVGISGLYAPRMAMQLFEEADCVIAIGASMTHYTTSHGFLYPNARIVHIDSKPHVMIGAGLIAECYVQTDARLGAEALGDLLARRSVTISGYRTPEVRERLRTVFEDRTEFEIEPGRVDPRLVCRMLDEVIPADIGVGTSSGHVAGFSNMLLNRPRPLVLASKFFTCVGQMLPAAMGAVVATGNKPMFLVDGDASVIMHLADFHTAVRYGMPLLVVVLNDEALGAEYHNLRSRHLNAELALNPIPDLGAFAEWCGGKGRLARSVEEVRAAAEQWVAQPCPMMIDVRISRNVVALPKLRLNYARDE